MAMMNDQGLAVPRSHAEFERSYANIFLDTIIRMYFWIGLGLVLTGATAWFVHWSKLLYGIGFWGFLALIGAQFGLMFATYAAAQRSIALGVALYFAFNIAMGATMSFIFVAYTGSDISLTFILTACLFGIMSVIGFTTKKDLSGLGSVLFVGLIGVVGVSLVNIFVDSSAIMWLVTIVALPVFLGLTVWETNKVKNLAKEAAYAGDERASAQISIISSIGLYLNIMNLFLILLRITSLDFSDVTGLFSR